MSAADARAAAARIVGRVVREGAYSNVVSRVETDGLNSSDRNLAHALAFDTLRRLLAVDATIERHSKRPPASIDEPLRDLLRVGVTELGRGDRPAALTVDAVVRAAKRLSPSYAGFANGILRAIGRADLDLSTPVPAWLASALAPEFDEAEVERFWEASLSTPQTGLRGSADALPASTVAVPGIPGAHLSSGPIPSGVEIQDPASVAVGNAVDAQPGQRILDIAAAPGGKTLQLVETGAEVVAADVHARRAADGAARVPGARWVIADGREPPFAPGSFDAVLLDAPCSGLGTLRRRPEIAWRVDHADVGRLSGLQRELLASALALVRPGGRLVYSVCTVTPAETVDVVAGVGATPPQADLPGRPMGDGWLLAPHLGPTDGMFVAVIDR